MSQIARTFDVADRPDYSNFALAAGTGRRQPMHGFDADYVDIVDYIVRCTHKIWEEKAIGLIDTHYAHNILVHTGNGGTMYGQEAVVAHTLQRISGLADRRLYADDLIWSGNETDSFYTSHRLYTVGRHTRHTALGPPTGRRFLLIGMSHHTIQGGQIVKEWTVFDESELLKQLYGQVEA
ncbi:ester cyclase [Deinococcus sp. QL22]|uniref:ester cyclase n=1 Tax=Deinococcus sp. QL22 TaxID=2939437 RepID=UPI002016F7FF|nr:ester cyclase [Deinococcus sp. QL22]UQN08316.1 ester cyclase [Deinococcus sp. QL22]